MCPVQLKSATLHLFQIEKQRFQDGHGQPVSCPAIACWVWGSQSQRLTAATIGWKEIQDFFFIKNIFQLQQMSSSLQQLSATQQQQLLARYFLSQYSLWSLPQPKINKIGPKKLSMTAKTKDWCWVKIALIHFYGFGLRAPSIFSLYRHKPDADHPLKWWF